MIIKCRFCKKVLGTAQFEDPDVVDSRCENCEATNGNYVKMEREFTAQFGNDPEEIKKHFEKVDFKKSEHEKEMKKRLQIDDKKEAEFI